MDRLTRIDAGGCITGARREAGDYVSTEEMLKQLREYELTGLTPEQIPEMSQMFRDKCEEVNRLEKECVNKQDEAYDLGYQSCLRNKGLSWSEAEELQHYRKLKEQGRLIELPCTIGDMVYEPNKRGFISTYKVTSIAVMTGSRNCNWELIDGIYSNLNGFNEYALGKSVFLTKQAAEKALAERQVQE